MTSRAGHAFAVPLSFDSPSSEAAWIGEDPAFSAVVELTYDSNPSIVDEESPIVKAMQAAHAHIGKECPLMGTPQHDDADYLTNVAHIPTVLYGPGTGLLAHMPNEYVKIEELVQAAQVYALAIMEALQ